MEKIIVKDMKCAHCVARISKALNENEITHDINLTTKTIALQNSDDAMKIITKLGYHPEILKTGE